jgi:SAM-dependent methyltransferase
MLENVKNKFRREGAAGVYEGIYRRIFHPECNSFRSHKRLMAGKIGLEIGGPSSIFSRQGLFPVYPVAEKLDNCNFSHSTTWEGSISEGETFAFDRSKAAGRQFISEAWDLAEIPEDSYEFVLSSHMIEHTANPIRAVSEWLRVLTQTGTLVIIFPHKNGTFDRLRPVTQLDHLIQDFSANVGEDDLTHLPEILKLHDLELDPEAGSYESFANRSKSNFENRCLHHHVFDARLAVSLIDYMRLQIVSVEVLRPYHIIVVARKMLEEKSVNNSEYLLDSAHFYHSSPFKS